ncbi:LexA family transcriptional regulator [Fulvivirga sp.]|uniref:XRE family transcriptional regulator n=1 Tax=Fulvivirga sp. TaxID=1931237 RepID=UPI0032EE82EC
MKNYNRDKSRITMLREMLGLSQKDFSDNAGVSQSALSQLETGKTKISLDTLQKISLAFKVNCNWLVNGKGDIFLKEITKNKIKIRNSILTMDIQDTALIPLISEEAHAGYINGHQDTDYLGRLDVYKIPGYEHGNYRLFEVNGDSMIPTIYPREILVSEHADNWDEIENGSLCIVITEDGIVAKRTYFYEEDRSMLILKSDNAKYKTHSVPIDDVLEIWYIRARITNIFSHEQPFDFQKIRTLESDMAELKAQMKNLTDSSK